MKYHLCAIYMLKIGIKKRAWCYELFVHLHIICGIGYVGLLFWHCGNMLTSVRNRSRPPFSSLLLLTPHGSGTISMRLSVSGSPTSHTAFVSEPIGLALTHFKATQQL